MIPVTRVRVRAPVASFRHPFFVTGKQPTALMPPPSTVFGHCGSALGYWPDPKTFFFGLHFTWQSRTVDLEHQHITQALGAKTKTFINAEEGPVRATTEVGVQPVGREFLFNVDMTLYLPPNIGAAFRNPVHTVVLGRSQDLAEVVAVEDIELKEPEQVCLEHTILPFRVRPCLHFGTTVLLSKYVSEPPEREVVFERYIVLREPVFWGEGADPSRALVRVPGVEWSGFCADLDFVDNGFARGVWLHRLTSDYVGAA